MLQCSVIVPTYNRRRLLRATLQSLAAQVAPGIKYEVIVVDDGSSDGSFEEVREFGERLEIRYAWMPDLGFRVAAARNVGISLARGSVLVFLDSGVVAGANLVKAHVSAHSVTDENLAVIGYVRGLADGEGRTLKGAAHCGNRAGRSIDPRDIVYDAVNNDVSILSAPWALFWTCNCSVSGDLTRSINGFDESFTSWGAEDIEFGYRLHLAGAVFRLHPQANALHINHARNATFEARSASQNYRYMARKHGRPISELLLPRAIWEAHLTRSQTSSFHGSASAGRGPHGDEGGVRS